MQVSNKDCMIAVLLVFLGVISFFNVDSAMADEHNLNTSLIVAGIVSILTGLFFLVGKPYIRSKKNK